MIGAIFHKYSNESYPLYYKGLTDKPIHNRLYQMNQYLEFGASNCLLQAVKSDLKVPEYLAACKALGLVSHLIMLPLWSQIENTDISILEIAQYYKELVIYLENIDYNKFITGQSLLSFVNEDMSSDFYREHQVINCCNNFQ